MVALAAFVLVVAEVAYAADFQHRKLQQDIPGVITGPLGWMAGGLCGAIPRGVYTNYLGVPWWAPMGIAQGICSNQLYGGILGMSY